MAHKYIDPISEKEKSSRHANKQKIKKYLDRLYDYTKNWYPSPVIKHCSYQFSTNEYLPDKYLKKCYRGKNSRDLKKISHRKFRRHRYTFAANSSYHKSFDFWWELT